jgi:hypothetical protein
VQGFFPQPSHILMISPEVKGHGAPVFKIPGRLGSGGIVFDMFDIPASFQYQRFQPLIAKLLGGPPAGGPGTDHNGVIFSFLFGVLQIGHIFRSLLQHIR